MNDTNLQSKAGTWHPVLSLFWCLGCHLLMSLAWFANGLALLWPGNRDWLRSWWLCRWAVVCTGPRRKHLLWVFRQIICSFFVVLRDLTKSFFCQSSSNFIRLFIAIFTPSSNQINLQRSHLFHRLHLGKWN